jgi:hypothetical protein
MSRIPQKICGQADFALFGCLAEESAAVNAIGRADRVDDLEKIEPRQDQAQERLGVSVLLHGHQSGKHDEVDESLDQLAVIKGADAEGKERGQKPGQKRGFAGFRDDDFLLNNDFLFHILFLL